MFIIIVFYTIMTGENRNLPTVSIPAELVQADSRHVDDLTGLRNRAWLDRALPILAEQFPGNFAVVIMDLDRLKHVNDTDGHDAGDRLLCAAAHALETMARETDLLAARPHGDEFFLLLPGVNNDEDLASAIARIQGGMDEVGVAASAGGSVHQNDTSTSEMLKRADEEMYTNKIERLPVLDIKSRIGIWAGDLALRFSGVEPRDLPKHIAKLNKDQKVTEGNRLRLRDALRGQDSKD